MLQAEVARLAGDVADLVAAQKSVDFANEAAMERAALTTPDHVHTQV